MKRLMVLLFAVPGLAHMGVTLAATGNERPVNVILIYLDDMGYGDLSMTCGPGTLTPGIITRPCR